jgi:hypothetical protein
MVLLIKAALEDQADFDFMAYCVRRVIEPDQDFIRHLLAPLKHPTTFDEWVAWRINRMAQDKPPVRAPTWRQVIGVLATLPFQSHLCIEYTAHGETAMLCRVPNWLDEKPDSIKRMPIDSSRASFIPAKSRALQRVLNAMWSGICGGALPDRKAAFGQALDGFVTGTLSATETVKTLERISGWPMEQVRAALRPFLAERNRCMVRATSYNDEAPPGSSDFDYDAVDAALGWKEEERDRRQSRKVRVRRVPVATMAAALGVSRLTVRRWCGR